VIVMDNDWSLSDFVCFFFSWAFFIDVDRFWLGVFSCVFVLVDVGWILLDFVPVSFVFKWVLLVLIDLVWFSALFYLFLMGVCWTVVGFVCFFFHLVFYWCSWILVACCLLLFVFHLFFLWIFIDVASSLVDSVRHSFFFSLLFVDLNWLLVDVFACHVVSKWFQLMLLGR